MKVLGSNMKGIGRDSTGEVLKHTRKVPGKYKKSTGNVPGKFIESIGKNPER